MSNTFHMAITGHMDSSQSLCFLPPLSLCILAPPEAEETCSDGEGCLFFFCKFLNWRIIALQCCVDFCCTAVQISHNYMYIYPLPLEAPSHLPSHPSRSSQSTSLGSLLYSSFSLIICFTDSDAESLASVHQC